MHIFAMTVAFLMASVIADSVLAEEINALRFFESEGTEGKVVIIAGVDDVVVFKEKESPYQLKGRDFILISSKVRVNGNIEIRSFPVDSTAAGYTSPAEKPKDIDGGPGISGKHENAPNRPNGSPGGQGGLGAKGAVGKTGSEVGLIVLNLKGLEGGRLTIVGNGQGGGQGQSGSIGGNGGQGGSGHDRDGCNAFCNCNEVGDGAIGGPAGPGGNGGDGGPGGSGARIEASLNTIELTEQRKIRFFFNGGAGGKGGIGGPPGQPGGGGIGGAGTRNCGSGGTTLGPGSTNNKGDDGNSGSPGAAGTLLCTDCKESDTILGKEISSLHATYIGPSEKVAIPVTIERPKIAVVTDGGVSALCFAGIRQEENEIRLPKFLFLGGNLLRRSTTEVFEFTRLKDPVATCPTPKATDKSPSLVFEPDKSPRVVLVLKPDGSAPARAICVIYGVCLSPKEPGKKNLKRG